MTPHVASEITRREWRYERQGGVIVYPVKGWSDNQLDYAAFPLRMGKARTSSTSAAGRASNGTTARNGRRSPAISRANHEPVRVPFLPPDLPPGLVPRICRRAREQSPLRCSCDSDDSHHFPPHWPRRFCRSLYSFAFVTAPACSALSQAFSAPGQSFRFCRATPSS